MKNFKPWLIASGIRAIKTMAQTAVAMLGTHTILSEINITMVLSTTVLSGILSILTSIAGLPELKEG